MIVYLRVWEGVDTPQSEVGSREGHGGSGQISRFLPGGILNLQNSLYHRPTPTVSSLALTVRHTRRYSLYAFASHACGMPVLTAHLRVTAGRKIYPCGDCGLGDEIAIWRFKITSQREGLDGLGKRRKALPRNVDW